MKAKRKICVVTGSRAEYGHLYWLMKGIQGDKDLRLQIAVTGSHLDGGFGSTYKAIERDGFRINEKIAILGEENTNVGVAKSLGKATTGFAEAFDRLKPDLVVVLGDRFEILAAAQACLILRIPVAHIAGGDTTEGAFDESLRHSITKMSQLHFVTNEVSAQRVKQMGENPQYIFNYGSPGLDHLHRMKFLKRVEVERELGFKFRKRNLLVTFHPATLDFELGTRQFGELLRALEGLGKDVGIVLTKSNADPQGRLLNKMAEDFADTHSNAQAFTSLGQLLYLSTMKYVSAVVGNSSSGLYEAPSFKIPTVNIGDRQKGRLAASSVIHCKPRAESISRAVQKAFALDCSETVNPYGDGHSSERILRKIKDISNPSALIQKHFFTSSSPFTAEDAPGLPGVSGAVPARGSRPRAGGGEAKLSRPLTNRRVFIVAEAGVNHNGSLEMAKKLVDCAVQAGADAVKFQTFKADNVVTRKAEKAAYQKQSTFSRESQWSMLKKLELDEKAHFELRDYCRKLKIEFLSTPFDLESVDLLVKKLGLQRLKIPSGEITNAPLLLKIARTGLPVILSTGMAALDEIREALGVLAFGYTHENNAKPSTDSFQKAFGNPAGQSALKEKITLLHCTTEYPAPYQDVNLLAMDGLRDQFNLPVGLSDHSQGIAVPIAAAARGAVVIEKHFTLDRGLPGPDHQASLEPQELKAMVESIRNVEQALGRSQKVPAPSELKNRPIARKSLVTRKAIQAGERFTEQNLTAKRPGTGISPMYYWDWLGKAATKSYDEDEILNGHE